MATQINLWREEHARFRRLLDLLEANIGLLGADHSRVNDALMLDILYYLRHFPDHFHHPKENAAIVRLYEREARSSALLRRLQGDHEVLKRSGAYLLEQLQAISAGAMVLRASVEAAAAAYSAYYRQHLAREERELFPRVQRLFDKSDWVAVEAAVPTQRDPLFGERIEERYQELHRYIALEGECGCLTPEPEVTMRTGGPRSDEAVTEGSETSSH